jgi:hypothetical protein
MRGLPGKFARQDIGRRKKNIEGWRDFDFFHPEAVVYGNGGSNAKTQLETLVVNSNRQIVATFKDVLDADGNGNGATTMPLSDVYSIPLRNKDGTPITFADSFILKTQLEIISDSGDIDNATDKTQPFLGMGFGQHADIGDSTNHYITNGLWLFEENASNETVYKIVRFRTNGDDSHTTCLANDSGTRGTTTKHLIVEYFVGPLIGATETDDDNVVSVSWAGKNKTGNYDKNTDGTLGEFEMANANGYIDVDTQVYLYAFFGSNRPTDGSNDPAVVTCRMRYMVNANVGKDGTGAA